MELSALGEHRASLHVLFAPERAMPKAEEKVSNQRVRGGGYIGASAHK